MSHIHYQENQENIIVLYIHCNHISVTARFRYDWQAYQYMEKEHLYGAFVDDIVQLRDMKRKGYELKRAAINLVKNAGDINNCFGDYKIIKIKREQEFTPEKLWNSGQDVKYSVDYEVKGGGAF